MSPTARSLDYLRSQGWLAFIVERWIPRANIRLDFGGFADLLAYRVGDPMLAIQCCRASDLAARASKLGGHEPALMWVQAGHRLSLFGWALRPMDGRRGARKVWVLSQRHGMVRQGRLGFISLELKTSE